METELLYAWSGGTLDDWVLEGDARVCVTEGGAIRLETIDPGFGYPACTLWLRQPLPADYRIAFDFRWIEGPGSNIVFFSATGTGQESIFSWSRSGSWASYVNTRLMRLYTVSFCKGEGEPVTGLRKIWAPPPPAAGQELCPRVAEVPDICTERERWYHIEIGKYGARVTFSVDGTCLHDWIDDGAFGPPLEGGCFGLRNFDRPKVAEFAHITIRA